MAHLGLDRYEHFGSSPSFFARDDFTAHIPRREPMEVARSWAKRGKPLDELLVRYQAMLEFIENRTNVVVYSTEDLGIVLGSGEHTQDDSMVPEYQDALRRLIDG